MTMMRQFNLSTVLMFRLVSTRVRERFPDNESLVRAKFLTPKEKVKLDRLIQISPFESSWAPSAWALSLLAEARNQDKVKVSSPCHAGIQESIERLEEKHRHLLNFGWVNFPLAYTQVATLAVLATSMFSTMGNQFLEPHNVLPEDEYIFNTTRYTNMWHSGNEPFDLHTPNIFIPIYGILQFSFLVGWIKVAECLLNPFGNDDVDFQLNYLIDRNIKVRPTGQCRVLHSSQCCFRCVTQS